MLGFNPHNAMHISRYKQYRYQSLLDSVYKSDDHANIILLASGEAVPPIDCLVHERTHRLDIPTGTVRRETQGFGDSLRCKGDLDRVESPRFGSVIDVRVGVHEMVTS